MVTPLLEILHDLLTGDVELSAEALAAHGYSEIDGPDIQEALLAWAESMPAVESSRLVEIADGLDLEAALGLEGAAAALREARVAYEAILEAEADSHLDGPFVETSDDAELDLDIDTTEDANVSVSVNVSGDDDPDIEVDISGDSDPSVDIVVNGESVDLDDLDDDGDFLGEMTEGEPPETDAGPDLDLDLD